MPYINPTKRVMLDPVIDEMLNTLRELESDDPTNSMAGNLNYMFTRLLDRVYAAPRYDEVNEAVGVLECCKQEFYRRVAAPYEDQKRFENGDAYDSGTILG